MRDYLVFLLVLITSIAAPARAQDSVSRNQDEILAELRQLRSLIESKLNTQTPPPNLPGAAAGQIPIPIIDINVEDSPVLGSKDARLTIVEFADFQCPYCRRFYEETFPDLKKNYIDSGKVRFYHMDLPLDIHRNAFLAAQAGRCAADQGQFWPMHDRMLVNPERLELTNLTQYAQELGIDIPVFRKCVEVGKYQQDIQQAARNAMMRGARGTPAFVIGKSTPSGVEGELVIGAEPYSLFDNKLKQLMR